MNSDIIQVGFTGTRKGMSLFQKQQLVGILCNFRNDGTIISWHHGCCEGADVEFDDIVRKFYPNGNLHPSNHLKTQVNCFVEGDSLYASKPPLKRDQDIVNAVELLIAAPKNDNESLRSGTWTTVRYARKRGIYVWILDR